MTTRRKILSALAYAPLAAALLLGGCTEQKTSEATGGGTTDGATGTATVIEAFNVSP